MPTEPVVKKINPTTGAYYHMWWDCKKIQELWHKIWSWLEEMLGIKINFTPEMFLLGITNENFSKVDIYLIITAARLLSNVNMYIHMYMYMYVYINVYIV
uniref:Uncharacterized protein n=1 Tax=Laticauda laticaudata TaxID=8630 RepID=A0A8C5S4Q2_LATLA